jgi:hypothetical protein
MSTGFGDSADVHGVRGDSGLVGGVAMGRSGNADDYLSGGMSAAFAALAQENDKKARA